jgi:hypothetical protein
MAAKRSAHGSLAVAAFSVNVNETKPVTRHCQPSFGESVFISGVYEETMTVAFRASPPNPLFGARVPAAGLNTPLSGYKEAGR